MSETLGHTMGATQTPPRKTAESHEQPQLFVALECDRPCAKSTRHSLAGISQVDIGRGRERYADRINLAGAGGLSLRVPDRWMSSEHARLTCSFGRWILEDRGSKNGTLVDGERVERHTLRDGDLFELGHTLFLYRDGVSVQDDDALDLDTAQMLATTPGLVTLVAPLARDLAKLSQLAPSEVSILLLGESGTGKEVVARAIATLSGRSRGMVGVNCGAIPASLIESELFGHKKGAFSGAVADSPGLIRAAHQGTLFLDEIGDLPAASQAAFLRVLQEREVRPVGDSQSYPVDIRLVSATHQDLLALVDRGAFRNDLFARISGYRMTLPPLRERIEDLGHLIGELLPRVVPSGAEAIEIDVAAARALFAYRWPLNIRELENCLRTAVVLANGQPIQTEHLPESIRVPREPAPSEPARDLSEEQREHRDELVALFREHGGNVSAVARALGKDRKQIQRWIKRYELDPDSYR